MTKSLPRTFAVALFLSFLSSAAVTGTAVAQAPAIAPPNSTIVVADPNDAYYSLAEEIAQTEGIAMADSLTDAISLNPTFIVWVVCPKHLSDQIMASVGHEMLEWPSAVSMGIISGSTLEQARELWRRAGQVKGERAFAASAANPSARILQGRIIEFNSHEGQTMPLTKANLLRVLREADYLSFTGHGSGSYLRLSDDVTLRRDDVPLLSSIVISTGSCQTFRIWRDDSISLRLVDQGAAAYSGFVWSPNEGYLIGEFVDLPFRYSWPGFPIGHIVQAQTQGTLQGFASLPYHYLLGDPRIALQREAPYSLREDRVEGHTRIVSCTGAPPGLIPIRIPDGAGQTFVEVPGVTAAWERDPFYNSRLQMVDIREDKYVLLVHRGGDFSLRLRPGPPWYWVAADPLLDSLDHALLFARQSGGFTVLLGAAVLPALLIVYLLARKKASPRFLPPAALVGLGFATLEGAYSLLRLGKLTVTSKPVSFTPLGLLGSFLLTSCGVFLFLNAHTWRGRAVGLLVATFEGWAQAILGLGIGAATNLLSASQPQGVACWNCALGLMSLIFALPHGLMRLIVLLLMRGTIDKTVSRDRLPDPL